MLKLSQQALDYSANILQGIKNHPFNQELMQGTLALDKFAFYIEQDSRYLQDFAKCYAILAAKAPAKYMPFFLRHADSTIASEHTGVHQYFRNSLKLQEMGRITPATFSYTNYLLRICHNEILELGVASVLPCLWVYREVGLMMATQVSQHNPYLRWIEVYASDDFSKCVDEIINIFDVLGAQAGEVIRQSMIKIFYNSVCLEWHFWNDAYHKVVFDEIDG
jgi:thiaminase/transcriptional activator TenA